MKQLRTIAALVAIGTVAAPAFAAEGAGSIDRACLASNRPAVTPQLCGCLQSVANRTLTSSDRRTVAKFFAQPNRAQKIKMSNRRSDERLWERYTAFGELARAACN